MVDGASMIAKKFTLTVAAVLPAGCSSGSPLTGYVAETVQGQPALLFEFDSCGGLYDITVEESAASVAVPITQLDDGSEMLRCLDGELVHLAAPLSDRTVRDATTGDPLPTISDSR
ncbi:MAG: hypothetical protein GWP12_03220 [Nitrospirae bacterium]|nr:hypothetical protein [Nitrospirota bacterium]